MVNRVVPRDLSSRLVAGDQPLYGLLPLVRRQLRLAAHLDAAGDCQPAALMRPLDDAFAFPFGHRREQGKEPAALWRASSDGKSSTRMDAPASITSLTICKPSHMDRVHRSHSASTSTSPGTKLASAAARFGRPMRDFPDAVSVKISAQRSAFSARTWRVKSCCAVLTRA